MAYIKYENSDEFVRASVIPVRNHVVRITTETSPNLNGFRLYLQENEEYPLDNGEYTGYTTLYRQGEGWFELSDDGSVWTEPEEVIPAEPTEEERAEMERQRRIATLQMQIDSLKEQLRATDYQITKTYEYSMVGKDAGYDIEALHAQRQTFRDEINELEAQVSAITTEYSNRT